MKRININKYVLYSILIVLGAVLVGLYASRDAQFISDMFTADIVRPSVHNTVEFQKTENELVSEVEQIAMTDTQKEMTDTSSNAEEEIHMTAITENVIAPDPNARATMMVAGGCFWCVEADLEKLPGVLEAVSGYAGGASENPTYEDYADGGHREVVEVTYNPSVVSYREIFIYAVKHMDPTDPDGSFFDRGVEYSPAIYYRSEEERTSAEAVIAEIDALGIYDKPLALAVEAYPTFWEAEDYHQDYYKGTLTSLKYRFYRTGSGRDAFIKQHWGDDTGPSLPIDSEQYDVSAWQNFEKPSDEELRSTLTSMQYRVTQHEGTEPPFDNEYWGNPEEGIYVDIVSGEPLFSSTDKFDSGTGWPSFTKPLYPNAVTEHADYKLIIPRTEIRSRFADSHLGHVFNDAPPELGGVRYCMNSAALRFVPKADMETEGYGQFLVLFE